MNLSDLASLGSFISGLGVLISLAFLYFQLRQVSRQMKQSEKNQEASIRQSRTSRATAISMGATVPALADAIYKAHTGAKDISTTQLIQFGRYCGAVFDSYEDMFYQHHDGLVSDAAFSAVVNAVQGALRVPSFRVQWKRMRTGFGNEFAAFIDGILANTPAVMPSYEPADWLSAVAKEIAA
jgi:hypothetical protein